MSVLHNEDSLDVETELRDLLRSRSAGLVLDPPEWQDLIEQPRTVVFALDRAGKGGKGGDAAGRDASPWRQRPKPVFIAAAAVAVVLAGGVAAKSVTSSDSSTLGESPAAFSAAAPSEADFDAHTAPAVYASDVTDPVAAAQAYLASTGVAGAAPSTPVTPQAPTFELLSNEDGVATVSWSAVEGTVTRNGTVYLRTAPVEQAESTVASTWSVVGSTVDGVVLTDVAYSDGQLTFNVTKTADVAGPLAVSVWSNGQQVAVDGDAVQAAAGAAEDGAGAGAATEDGSVNAGAGASGDGAGAGANADPAGQLVDLANQAGSSAPLSAAVAEASTTLVRVQQLVDGQPASVTEMAVALPGADGDVAADVSGAAESDAGVDAGVSGDAGAGAGAGGSGGANADAGAGGSTSTDGPLSDAGAAVDDVLEGGTTIPLPGGHEATTPSVPTTLPPLPTPTTVGPVPGR
jgi:hypothetical protein